MNRLQHTLRLDPRPEQDSRAAPRPGSVNIPFDELSRRVHELPPRDETTLVVGDEAWSAAALDWLSRSARSCAPAPPLQPGEARSCRLRLWKPSAFLETIVDRLRPGRALDVACGSGRDAVFLANRGWSVTAVDVLPDALALGRDLERRYRAGDARPVEWRTVDIEGAPPPAEFRGAFDLVCVFRYLHRPLMPELASWLTPGGSLVYETFTTVHRARHGKPGNDAHVLLPGELPHLLAGLAHRVAEEGWHGNAHTARVWAVRC